MKHFITSTVVVIVSFALAYAAVGFFRNDVSGSAEKPQMDKATYLKTVRKNNPEYPDLMECIYSQYIDKHGVEETLKMDMKYYDSNDMPESLRNEVVEMGANC